MTTQPIVASDPAQQIERAIAWVVERMAGLHRKGGKRPMCVHSLRVGLALDRAGESIEVIVAGFLHDLIEDAGVTSAEIKEAFDENIASLVLACTHDIELHEHDRDAANEDLFQRAVAHGRNAVVIKMADAADNILSLHDLSPDRQQQFMIRAQRWLDAGEPLLGADHYVSRQLRRRIERAK